MKAQIQISEFKSPVGELIIGSLDERICLCDWKYRKMRDAIDKRIQNKLYAEYVDSISEVSKECVRQLNAYFGKELTDFNLPLLYAGSEFQQQVWNELVEVPYGTTESYLGLSKRISNVDAIRAVAAANGANAISIIVPCHRIVASNGDLTGYAGGLVAKKKLLQLEGNNPYQTSLFDD